MMNSVGKTCTVLVLAVLLLAAGAAAAPPISTIAAGDTVFLGEEGLDITAAMGTDTRIAWWASGAPVYSACSACSGGQILSSPSYTIPVSNPSAFFISPSEFSGRLGPWYRLNAAGEVDGTAFVVTDPDIDLRVYDASLGVDATANGWITSGDEVEFRITTNLYQILGRAGVSAVPIRIGVQSPDGATYSSLINKAGTTTSIMDVPLSGSPYSTGPIWDTGRYDTYPFGTYRIWVECNVNSMKDNYPESGKTYTPGWGILDQERNPLISTYTTSPTTRATSAPTTVMTTAPTTVQTTVTTPPVVLTTLTTVPTTVSPAVPATTSTTRSPGFEAGFAGAALLLALVWAVRKE